MQTIFVGENTIHLLSFYIQSYVHIRNFAFYIGHKANDNYNDDNDFDINNINDDFIPFYSQFN